MGQCGCGLISVALVPAGPFYRRQSIAAFGNPPSSGKAYEAEAGPRGLSGPRLIPKTTDGFCPYAEIAALLNMQQSQGRGHNHVDGNRGYQGAGYAYARGPRLRPTGRKVLVYKH